MHGRRGLLIAGSCVLLWVLGGAVVYFAIGNCSTFTRTDPEGVAYDYTQCPWNFAQSFYFSVQTGLSIGFGLLVESSKGSELYSCFHILMGSSVIGGALALFANMALSRSHHFQTKRERDLVRHLVSLHTGHGDVYEELSLDELRSLMVAHPHYAEMLIHKSEPNKQAAKELIKQFEEADEAQRLALSREILAGAAHLPQLKDSKVSIDDLKAIDDQAASPWVRFRRFWRQNRNFLSAKMALTFYLVIGTVFSVTADDNDFITGLYFSISTLSTAGMVSVKTVESNAHVLFAAFFALTGIPVYGTFLSLFANVLVDRYQGAKQKEQMEAKFTENEVAFMDHLTGHTNDSVSLAEFVEMQLLRMGMVDRETLSALRQQFKNLDKEGTGAIKKSDFLHPLALEKA